MKMPPFLLGAALAFWGWRTGLWWLGLPLGLLAELPRRLEWRWELSPNERRRVADLCALLIALAGAYLYFTQPRLGLGVILLIQWLPVLVFPLLAVQLFGDRPGLELSTLYFSLRGRPEGERLWDPGPPYLLLCLVAAAMVPTGQDRFYLPALALFAAWALWSRHRPRRPAVWAGALILALGLGEGIALGLQQTQRGIEEAVVAWLSDWLASSTDPYRASTAIGDVGLLKLSERIALRVRPDRALVSPLLLRTAAYNRYLRGNWIARHLPFDPLTQERSGWRIAPSLDGTSGVEIELDLDDGRGVLPLPANAVSVRGLEGARLSRNPYGAVKVLEGPASARYQAPYAGEIHDLAPEPDDLRVPQTEAPEISRIVSELGLADLDPERALSRLRRWFLTEFTYSLQLEASTGEHTDLGHFLTDGRSGHCEYFATAAVLLLREAGIPARYVRGWSIQEYSDLEDAYVARGRHAHAWVQAWVDGAWRNFDPTPPDWSALEEEARPWWGPIQDLFSRLAYLLSQADTDGKDTSYLIWLLPPLAALLAWRIARHGRRATRRQKVQADRRDTVETPFAPVEAALARHGHGRRRGETLREWAMRLETVPVGDPLTRAVEIYYRKRFDPPGLDADAEKRLAHLLEECARR